MLRRSAHSLAASPARAIAGIVLLACVVIVGIGAWRLSLAAGPPRLSSLRQHCRPLTTDWSGNFHQCFPPSQLGQAVQGLPFRPLDPSRIVWAIAHLHLTQVTVLHPIKPDSGPDPRVAATGITYAFGRLPPNKDMIPIPIPSRPQFLFIDESAAHPVPRWDRLNRASGIVWAGPAQHRRYGPWTVGINLPVRGLFVQLETGLPKTAVLRLLASMERAGHKP